MCAVYMVCRNICEVLSITRRCGICPVLCVNDVCDVSYMCDIRYGVYAGDICDAPYAWVV